MGATGHPQRRRGTRTLILHGSNDPLLSVVRADIGGVKVFPGRGRGRGRSFVKRLSNDYIHVCVAHEREKGKEGAVGDGRALPSILDARLYGAHAPHVHVRPRILL